MSRAAVVTMVRDEGVFFPIWLRYYSRFFGPEDIYVLDHGTRDGSTGGAGFVRVPVHNATVDWAWHRDMIQAQQQALLRRYDTVLVTDVDEIVAPDPRAGDLADYVAAFDRDFVTCRGYEVIHMRESEAAFDAERPVLDQRGWWFFNPAYCKPLLAREPMHWHGGMHHRTDGRTAEDGTLHLLHLHRMDFELCRERHVARVSVPWNPRDRDQGWGYQNRIVEHDAFTRWFYADSGCGGYPVAPKPIPERWRGVV